MKLRDLIIDKSAIISEYPEISVEYLKLPQINKDDIQIRWSDDWWDGYLSGVAVYKNENYFFIMCDDWAFYPSKTDISDTARRYVLVDLSEEKLRQEQYWHDLFVKEVTSKDGDNDKFYIPFRKAQEKLGQDKLDNEVIGWFEL